MSSSLSIEGKGGGFKLEGCKRGGACGAFECSDEDGTSLRGFPPSVACAGELGEDGEEGAEECGIEQDEDGGMVKDGGARIRKNFHIILFSTLVVFNFRLSGDLYSYYSTVLVACTVRVL